MAKENGPTLLLFQVLAASGQPFLIKEIRIGETCPVAKEPVIGDIGIGHPLDLLRRFEKGVRFDQAIWSQPLQGRPQRLHVHALITLHDPNLSCLTLLSTHRSPLCQDGLPAFPQPSLCGRGGKLIVIAFPHFLILR